MQMLNPNSEMSSAKKKKVINESSFLTHKHLLPFLYCHLADIFLPEVTTQTNV